MLKHLAYALVALTTLAACRQAAVTRPDPNTHTPNGFLKWSGGRVPYRVDASMARHTDSIKAVMRNWEANGTTGIRFVDAAETDKRYVLIKDGACVTSPTNADYPLEVKARVDCVGHELGHALGLIHEHQRYDRDAYVIVRTPKWWLWGQSQYEKLDQNDCRDYDLNSIMHYEVSHITVKHGKAIGREDNKPTTLDLLGLRQLYDGSLRCRPGQPAESESDAQAPTPPDNEPRWSASQYTALVADIQLVLNNAPDTASLSRLRTPNMATLGQFQAFVRDPFGAPRPSYEDLTQLYARLVGNRGAVTLNSFVEMQRDKSISSALQRSIVAFDGSDRTAAKSTTAGASSSGSAPVGLPLDSRIIYGTADFFVSRAKDEMVYAFLTDIAAQPDLRDALDAFLPTFMAAVRKLDATTPRNLVHVLRSAAIKDLEGLPERGTDLAKYPQGLRRAISPRYEQLLQGAHLGVTLGRELRDGASPMTVAAKLADLEVAELKDDDIRSALIILGVLAREYQGNAAAVWNIVNDPDQAGCFVALVIQSIANHPGFSPTWLTKLPPLPDADQVQRRTQALNQWARKHQRDIEQVVRQLHEIQEGVHALREERTRAMNANGAMPKSDSYFAAIRIAGQIVRSSGSLLHTDKQAQEITARLEEFVGFATELQQSVAQRDFGRLWVNISPYIVPAESEILDAASKKTYRIMSLASALATAESSEAVTRAIEAAAEPVGSYRAKRVGQPGTHPFSITINGYVGMGAGKEWTTDDHKSATATGMSLPIGFEFTRGGFNRKPLVGARKALFLLKPVRSFGLFIPIVDLGNVANYRLSSDDDVNEAPQVGFNQVFSPGAFITVGLGEKYPLSLGFGWQYAPSLRKHDLTDKTTGVTRLGAFLGVDIPVFRF